MSADRPDALSENLSALLQPLVEDLLEERRIHYGEWGEYSKHINVEKDGKTYTFKNEYNSGWIMEISDSDKADHEGYQRHEIQDPNDIAFLNELAKSDIPRAVLEELKNNWRMGENELDPYGSEVIVIEISKKRYTFEPTPHAEYSEWSMRVTKVNDDGTFDQNHDSVEMREDDDVAFLGDVFNREICPVLQRALEANSSFDADTNTISVEFEEKRYEFSPMEDKKWDLEIYEVSGGYNSGGEYISHPEEITFLQRLQNRFRIGEAVETQ
jgi:hypothetical protein